MTEKHHKNGVVYRTADSLTADGGAVHAFTTRLGGVSTGIYASLNLSSNRDDLPENVEMNYRRLCEVLGMPYNRVAKTKQVHGDRIRIVTESEFPSDPCMDGPEDCDGLITNLPDTVLAVFTADCTPVLLYDPVAHAIGAVHAGWRGTVAQIGAKAVRMMAEQYGSKPENIRAAIGPSIASCCFETHRDVPDAVLDSFGPDGAVYIHDDNNGKYHVDLKSLNKLSLLRAGLKETHITVDPTCTCCNPDTYWSHRVTGSARGNQGGFIALTK